MRGFASSELEAGTIRSLVPQQVASLAASATPSRPDRRRHIWAAWVLLVHMLSDPRLRQLVQASPILDHEVAAAYLFTNYARAEVTRRARGAEGRRPKEGAANRRRRDEGKRATAARRRRASEVGKRDGRASGPSTARPQGRASADRHRARQGRRASELGTLRASSKAQARCRRRWPDKQTLSLKRKRPPCSGVVQVSGGVLDYWARRSPPSTPTSSSS